VSEANDSARHSRPQNTSSLIKLNLDYLLMLEMVKEEDGVMGRLEHNNQLGYQFSVLSR
jgi:hypothetical protein